MLSSSVITRNITQQTKHDILNSYSSEQGKQKVKRINVLDSSEVH